MPSDRQDDFDAFLDLMTHIASYVDQDDDLYNFPEDQSASRSLEILQGWLQYTNGDMEKAEKGRNHMHTSDILSEYGISTSVDWGKLEKFGQYCEIILLGILAKTYPRRKFEVEVFKDMESNDLEITYYEKKRLKY